MENNLIETGIDGCVIDLMPTFEKNDGGVFHMLPGGSGNADWYGGEILDVYGFFSKEPHAMRGGHYHPKLNEYFFPLSGTSLWILSDFRESSPTFGKTITLTIGDTQEQSDVPNYPLNQHPRLRVPAGVYHAIAPLSEDGFTVVALGTTPFDKEDYVYPTVDEVPEMKNILKTFSITPS